MFNGILIVVSVSACSLSNTIAELPTHPEHLSFPAVLKSGLVVNWFFLCTVLSFIVCRLSFAFTHCVVYTTIVSLRYCIITLVISEPLIDQRVMNKMVTMSGREQIITLFLETTATTTMTMIMTTTMMKMTTTPIMMRMRRRRTWWWRRRRWWWWWRWRQRRLWWGWNDDEHDGDDDDDDDDDDEDDDDKDDDDDDDDVKIPTLY
jgi:hypothetical protein